MADVLLQEIKTSRKQVKTITEQSYKQGKVEGDAGGQRRDVKKNSCSGMFHTFWK